MAGKNHPSEPNRTAVRTRPSLLRPALIAAAGILVLVVGLVLVIRSARSRTETPATAATAATTAPAPAATAVPAREEDGGAGESDLSEAMQSVPADTSGELTLRTAAKRDGFPMLSWDVREFVPDSRERMTYQGGAKTLTGIDVSEHQYDIDWKKVAADGIDFAMIRVGYRGSTAGGLYLDEYFEKNITGAHNAGIPVGVYFYSQAVTPEEAREEADFVLENIRGRHVTFPVVFDWEIVGGSEARTYAVSRRELCDCTRAFCDAVSEAGYDPMIYFTRYLAYRKYILRNLADYGFWYAEYEPQPRIAFDFDIWQYSETGEVDGIEGKVDLNLYFVR